MKHYCLGFVFDLDQERVLLLKKRSSDAYNPASWNGLGGQVETGETSLDAIVRECEEEASLRVDAPCWEHVGTMTDEKSFKVDVFCAMAHLSAARQSTDEEILILNREQVADLELADGVADVLSAWLAGGKLL